jgi:SOS-response transcriptional repressor LexA
MKPGNRHKSSRKKSTSPPLRPTTLEAFGASLRRRRTELKMTLDALMAKTEISKPYLSNIETGRVPGPASEDKLRRIAKALDMDENEVLAAADWLRTPESVRQLIESTHRSNSAVHRRSDGAIDLDAAIPPAPSAPPPATDGTIPIRSVPLINRVAAGRASEYTDMDYPRGIGDSYVPAPDLPDAPTASAFALKVVGDSMMPEYPDGEILIVGPAPEGDEPIKDGDDCVVRLDETENFATTFKRIYFARDAEGHPSAIRLMPLNSAHPERIVALEHVTGIYPLMYRLKPARREKNPPS